MNRITRAAATISIPAAVLIFFSQSASAACCPGDGRTSPKIAATGLGKSVPPADDQAVDASYRVYAFERDGIDYLQVNDLNGNVRIAIGYIGKTAWTMPIGSDIDRATILSAGNQGQGKLVYQAAGVTIRVNQLSDGDHWSVSFQGE